MLVYERIGFHRHDWNFVLKNYFHLLGGWSSTSNFCRVFKTIPILGFPFIKGGMRGSTPNFLGVEGKLRHRYSMYLLPYFPHKQWKHKVWSVKIQGGNVCEHDNIAIWFFLRFQFKDFYIFTQSLGFHDPMWLYHTFSNGWFNHQLI